MADVFLSYAREDREAVEFIAARLEENGWSVWFDRAILGGQRYRPVIDQELEAASCVVTLWSSASVGSDFVLDEADHANELGKLVSVMIEKVRKPKGFGQGQWIDLIGWEHDPALPSLAKLVADCAHLVQPSDTGRVSLDSGALPGRTTANDVASVESIASTTVTGPWVAISVGGQLRLIEGSATTLTTRPFGGVASESSGVEDLGGQTSALTISHDGSTLAASAGSCVVVASIRNDGGLQLWPCRFDLPSPDVALLAVRRVQNHVELLMRDDGSTVVARFDDRGRSSKQAAPSETRSAAGTPAGFIAIDSDGRMSRDPGASPFMSVLPSAQVTDVDVGTSGSTMLGATLSGEDGTLLRVARTDATGAVTTRAMHLSGGGTRIAIVRSTVKAEQPTMIAVETGGRVLVWAWDDLPETSE